jgi:hypothetical protein
LLVSIARAAGQQDDSKVADYNQFAYSQAMRTVFFETTSFTATVGNYLTDDEYRALQSHMQLNPHAGDVMPRTGGFRKLR